MKNTHVRLLFGLTLSLSLSVASSAEDLYAPDTPRARVRLKQLRMIQRNDAS